MTVTVTPPNKQQFAAHGPVRRVIMASKDGPATHIAMTQDNYDKLKAARRALPERSRENARKPVVQQPG